jgi:heme/copper-type cytochrome/quinol oxidase subunit 2
VRCGETQLAANRRGPVLLTVIVIAALAVVGVTAYLIDNHNNASSTGTSGATPLPSGCVKPANGFLIVASNLGYNDSIGHQAGPDNPWPVITVHKGQTVSIVVCNIDVQPHGFQISHYYDGHIETVDPGQVITLPPFVADQPGTFQIYCSIFCTIHIYMQYGHLVVSS